MNFFLQFLRIFDKNSKDPNQDQDPGPLFRVMNPDPGDQLVKDPPDLNHDPEHCFTKTFI